MHSSSVSKYFLFAGIGEYEDSVVKDMAAFLRSVVASLSILTLPERRVRKMVRQCREKLHQALREITGVGLRFANAARVRLDGPTDTVIAATIA
jgi:hypothetical protein